MSTKLTTADFIQRAQAIHGQDRYNYSSAIYAGALKKLQIKCSLHGSFEQAAHHHLEGRGCKKCAAAMTRKDTATFVAESKLVHGDRYDYSITKYIGAREDVAILCLKHGEFNQIAGDHVGGANCPACVGGVLKSLELFLAQAQDVHGDKFSYKKVDYVNARTHITIECKKHGDFLQVPDSHLRGAGCPKCQTWVSAMEKAWLGNMNVPDNNECRQVWVQTDRRKYLVDGFYDNTIYEFYGDFYHGNPTYFDREKINPIAGKSFEYLYNLTLEREALLRSTGLHFIKIWESDFSEFVSKRPELFDKATLAIAKRSVLVYKQHARKMNGV